MNHTDMLRLVQEDQKIFAFAKESGVLDHAFHPRNNSRSRTFSTAATLAAKLFWQTLEGAKLRIYLDCEYGIGSRSQEMTALKDALIIAFHDGWYQGQERGGRHERKSD